MTEDEKAALAKVKEAIVIPEKRAIDDVVESDNKRVKIGITA
jgi:hypothetical protein